MAEHLDDNLDDDSTRRLIEPLVRDAAPVDDARLVSLREATLNALTDSAIPRETAADNGVADLTGQTTKTDGAQPISTPDSKGNRMLVWTTRAMIAVTAATVVGFVWFFGGVSAEADVTLGEVLDATRDARTLHLQLMRDGNTADVWMQQGGRLRLEESATKYQIADGVSLWEVDEDINLARRSDDKLLTSAAVDLDLLALLGVNEQGESALRMARPVEVVMRDGAECQVYRATTVVGDRDLTFEAFVDRNSKALRQIVAWPAGAKAGGGPPLAELRLVSRNDDIDDSRFELADSLSEDGRIGKIAETQGIVLLRPKLNRRWTPVCRRLRLKPGDQLRTDVRGANAVSARLTSGALLVLGPGSLVEIVSPTDVRLHYGELQVSGGKKGKLSLQGPDKKPIVLVDKATLYRTNRNQELATAMGKPVWLLGFEGASSNESIGSLITKVDGRDVPLTIGYHKVKVEIRDQIARTTIEESFVNRTKSRLEGVFHFPLPQDASISGFGMWINGELVEADVVEKQRAREIYETILRERRDPGLLEWTGGNIFKARVFPIEPHSEKRIKIVYTQVLPLRANQYRYSYALRSEMLQKTPLRELSIDVLVHSALPVKKIDSPTHPVRVEQTANSASIQFTAQEYSPKRDFELVCELDGRQSDVVTIPHQRGTDGYFMVQLMPPSAEGNWQREVLPNGDPLEVLLVCDTSGSMDQANRKTQAEFVGAVLASLGPDDRFNIAVCDADCHWLFDDAVASDDESVQRARKWLTDRVSLGWTDLDKAFESIQQRAGKKSHVVYIGDGVVTARDVNPQDFAARIRRLYGTDTRGVFHAVSTGSSFESVVLKSIASLGRGSVRSIGSGQTSVSIALELLNEIAQPGLRDLKVEFRGVQVAAVYPQELPNLAAGSQQILIGRYLPTGKDQAGEIVVTGVHGGQPMRYSAKIPLAEAEQGNSFVPRLWARAHLDHLLQQGRSDSVKDDVIALSEEFHIITPYTSLLVLETDEDRERFGVKRRFQMRDGERFFADGRNAANYELLQQVIREAGNWRLALRSQVLRQLARLGRSLQTTQYLNQVLQRRKLTGTESAPTNAPSSGWGLRPIDENAVFGLGFGGGGGGIGGGGGGGDVEMLELSGSLRANGDRASVRGLGLPSQSSPAADKSASLDALHELTEDEAREEDGAEIVFSDGLSPARSSRSGLKGGDFTSRIDRQKSEANRALGDLGAFGPALRQAMEAVQSQQISSGGISSYSGIYSPASNYTAWINTLFPRLAPKPRPLLKAQTVNPDWPPEAIALARGLLRDEWLQKFRGGLELRRSTDSFDPRWDRQVSHQENLTLFSTKSWLTWSASGGNDKIVEWYDAKERGVFSTAFQLGRLRPSHPRDRLRSINAGLHAFGNGLHAAYREYDAKLVRVGGLKQIRLTNPRSPSFEVRFTIDEKKQVIVKQESLTDGVLQSSTTYSDFVQRQGAWWAGKIEARDRENRLNARTVVKLIEHDGAAIAARHAAELAARKTVQFIAYPLPSIAEAETSALDGSADFNDRLTLIARASQYQKWDDALEQLGELEEVAGEKTGCFWIRLAVLQSARRNAEARTQALAGAAQLSKPQPADLHRAQYLVNTAWNIGDSNEALALLDALKPVYDRQPNVSGANWTWQSHRLRGLRSLYRSQELLKLELAHANQQPWAMHVQTQYARDLAGFGNHAAAYAWLKTVLESESWQPQERGQAWGTWADLLQQEGASDAQLEIMEQWLKEQPTSEQPYARYLAALVFSNRVDDVQKTISRWLKESQIEGELTPADTARTGAAINHATGQGWGLYYHVQDPQWRTPLKEMTLHFLDHEHHFEFARRIMTRSQFSNTDEADAVRVKLFSMVREKAGELEAARLQQYVNWIRSGRPARDASQWKPIIETIRERWNGLKHTQKPDDPKHLLGQTLTTIHAANFATTHHLHFLREQVKQATKTWQDQYVQSLFDALMQQSWTEQLEVELFGLLSDIGENDRGAQLVKQVRAVHFLVDRMLAARSAEDRKSLQDSGRPDKLTRSELAKKKAGFVKAAREGLAKRLNAEAKKHPGKLGQWLQAERMYLDVILKKDLERVATECLTWLGKAPPVVKPAADDDRVFIEPAEAEKRLVETGEKIVLAALRQRALITYANLAVRRSAKPAMRNRLLSYIDDGIEAGGEGARVWKQLKYSLLIALDEPRLVERNVRQWIRTDRQTGAWRRMLARLAAERGEIDEAIGLFEQIQKDSQLSSADHTALANWYLVRDQKGKYRRAKVEAFKAVQEYQLSNFVRQRRYRWNQTGQPLPSELDENVLFAFQALFEKSASPGNYLYELREFYRACRDFRLLRMIPDSVVGRTPQQVYGFLKRLRTTVLRDLRKEATADEILGRIEQLRGGELTSIDRRALDVLESMIERQAADVLNQPGPHIEAAAAALKRSFSHEWASGEGRQMAELLHSFGRSPQSPLAKEQSRQLRALYTRETIGGEDRLFCGYYLADTLFSPYGQRTDGVNQMQIVIREYQQNHPQGWPASANTPLSGYVGMLESLKRHAEAEQVVRDLLEKPLNLGQRNWLKERLVDVYASAFSSGTQVSLGRGEELYRNLVEFIVEHARNGNDNHRYRVLQKMPSLFRAAKKKNVKTLSADMRNYAFVTLPAFLQQQRNNYRGLVDQTAYVLQELQGPRVGLEFLIDRIENYPARFKFSWENPWNRFGHRLGEWRQATGSLGDLEPRLLAIVLDELRLDLETRNQHSRYLYRKHSYFWAAKEADFAKAAEEVLAKHRKSSRTVSYIAEYFWRGLEHRNRAIEILFQADKDGLLDNSGLARLVDWLHDSRVKRYAESIPILERLVESDPVVMHHRCDLITAYHQTARSKQRSDLMKETLALFRQKGRWTQNNLAQLAGCSHFNRLHQRTIHLCGELIALIQRNHPTQGIGNGALSSYYAWLADAHSGLKQTEKAIDAAAAAIVSWGPSHGQRVYAVNKLNAITLAAKDLDEYLAEMDKRVEQTGQDSAIIRKSIGLAFAARKEHRKAIEQLRISLELQPGDLQTHASILKSFGELKDDQGAVQQLLALIDVDRRQLKHYVDLERRLKNDEAFAERAATSLVEAAPLEAESHQALAKIRTRDKQYQASILHWRQAAELRSLEPDGLINLAKAEIAAGDHASAQRSVERLQKTEWPSRFEGNVQNALNELNRLLAKQDNEK